MNTESDNKTGDLRQAVEQAMQLLSAGRAELARQQAEEILQHYPDEVNSQLVIAAAMREQGNNAEGLARLETLTSRVPDFALARQELGFAYADAKQPLKAIETLKKAVEIEPKLPAAWKLLSELHLAEDDEDAANEASARFSQVATKNPALARAAQLFEAGQIGPAERLTRDFLKEQPTDVIAIRLLADIGLRVGALDDAEKLLQRCLELDPEFSFARLNYANVLKKREKLQASLDQVDHLLKSDPGRFAYLVMRGSILIAMGDFDHALPIYERLIENYPPRPMVTLSYGHSLKTVGRVDESIAAYRKTIDLQPSFGDAYWSLANLKTFRFEDDDIETMKAELKNPDCKEEDNFHLCFALGKAYQDRKAFDDSFHFYRLGNNLKEKLEGYSADEMSESAQRIRQVCSRELVTTEGGCQAQDPIFVVGLPRSGSTLLEQILASHSEVDGTKELVHILAFVRRLSGKRKRTDTSQYPDVLKNLSADDLRSFGEEYLERSVVQRGDAPFFVDKAPNNFLHTGFINMILPNAKIIDARRHPMGACFSGYTQLFAKGQPFTYGLANVGRYYCDYLSTMDHWDAVLPGKVLKVLYEDIVNDTETQIRRILDYCGLPFEQNCLEFYRTERAIRTPSSEQVRQPIYRGGLDMWRNYDAHLEPLKSSLAPVLQRYPLD